MPGTKVQQEDRLPLALGEPTLLQETDINSTTSPTPSKKHPEEAVQGRPCGLVVSPQSLGVLGVPSCTMPGEARTSLGLISFSVRGDNKDA